MSVSKEQELTGRLRTLRVAQAPCIIFLSTELETGNSITWKSQYSLVHLNVDQRILTYLSFWFTSITYQKPIRDSSHEAETSR